MMKLSVLNKSTLAALVLGCGSGVIANFQDPSAEFRPKFRYWLPDASVPAEHVGDDIRNLASVGAGGLEFLPFYLYGLPVAAHDTPTDWAKYGFGTPAFNNLFKSALGVSREEGLLMDFAIGANQGQGVPSEPRTPGLAVHLIMGSSDINSSQTFEGAVPAPEVPEGVVSGAGFMHDMLLFGDPSLLAVVAGKIKSITPTPIEIPDYGTIEFETVAMDESSMIDLSDQITDDALHWEAPAGNSTWRIFSIWQQYTNQKSCEGGVGADTVIGNGSWTVDHLSKTGAKRVTDFWDENILSDPEIASLLSEVGKYAWEDSMEQNAALFWTPDLAERFHDLAGYSINTFLPGLFSMANTWNGMFPPYLSVYTYGNKTTTGESVHQLDYRRALNSGYQEYLAHFREWAHSRGFEFSSQPAYNLPLEMLADIGGVDAPEGESLGFNNTIDIYRQFSGPAHVHGRTVISNEVGAVRVPAYSQTVPELLESIRKSFAGGVTMSVIHGATYAGPYPNTTWPGYTPFYYQFTDMWSKIQPAWLHLKDTLDYIARNQYVLSQGAPKTDLAFYMYASPWASKTAYPSFNLVELGFTYDYMSGDSLLSPTVRDGALLPDGPAYKALIVYEQATIRMGYIKSMQKIAAGGVPVVFVGAVPSQTMPATDDALSAMQAALDELLATSNVHQVGSAEDLPSLLESLEIEPRVSLSCSDSGVTTLWRSSADADYLFLYNDGNSTTECYAAASVADAKQTTPYILAAWTGQEQRLAQFDSKGGRLTTTAALRSKETYIIALKREKRPSHRVALLNSSNVLWARYADDSETIIAAVSGPASISTLSGCQKTEHVYDPKLPATTDLEKWDVVLEDWHAAEDAFSIETEVTETRWPSHELVPWSEFGDGFEAVSGVGHYHTKFTVPNASSDSIVLGGLLSLGPVFNTVRVYLDGVALPPIDPSRPEIDLSPWLGQPGDSHELEVVATSTLFNRVRASPDKVMLWGTTAAEVQPLYGELPAQEYGLLGPVVIKWFSIEELKQ